jgi:D-inositol-3-phosphate glycosyltransferase
MAAFSAHLARAWRRRPPRMVHAHFWMSGMASLHAVRSLARSVPLIQTFHALGSVKRRHQGRADTSPLQRSATERVLARNVDRIVATCTDEVHELVALGADPARVRVVPCGVDPLFRPTGPVAPRRPGVPRVVVVSRLVPRKGVDDAIRAVAALPGVELVVAGGPAAPHHRQDPEVHRLQWVATDAGAGERVTFTGGLPRGEVAALMRSADVVVCSPWYEPFGIVPVEAMACGVPVVGTAVGGLLDTIVDGRTGVLVPPRDPEAIRRSLATLLGDRAWRARMGRAAAARVEQRYRWDRVARETLAIYDDSAASVARLDPAALA